MKRLFSLMLAACLLLAGCGSTKDTPSQPEGLYARAGGLPPDQELLTVNGQSVSAERYLYFLGRACDALAESWGGPPDWTARQGDVTLAEQTKAAALQSAALYAVVAQWGEEYLPDESPAPAALPAAPELSPALSQSLAADALGYEALTKLAARAGSPLSLSEEEAAAYAKEQALLSIAYVRVDTTAALLSGDMPALEARRTLTGELLAALQAEKDPLTALETMADEGQGISVSEKLVFSPGESGLGLAVERTAAFLAPNVWFAAPVEGDGGLYLLLGRPLTREDAALHSFHARLRRAADDATVSLTRAYRSLDAADFYAKLQTLRATPSTPASSLVQPLPPESQGG